MNFINASYYRRPRLIYPTPYERIDDLKHYLAKPKNRGKLFSLSATLDGMEYDYHRKQLRFLLRSVIAVHHDDTYSQPLLHDFQVDIREPKDHRKARAGIARSFRDGYQRILWFEGCLFDTETIDFIRNVTVSRYWDEPEWKDPTGKRSPPAEDTTGGRGRRR